ncbi:LysE family translocator [Pseudooceanicola sp.]|jgi:threonine/homoserine/homoserine lactone efflux protein|uniref:LysE family translocator n=1 Tax=Pseudooceanicola sp. TaxID=1914328 RepID=UPI00405997A7
MSHDVLLALVAFVFVATATPGPNNLMVMASGANFGFRRTLPHILGIAIGFAAMVTLVGFGLIRVFDAFPPVYTALKVASVFYLLWLAWKIAHAAPPADRSAEAGRPLTFLQAAAFQWVNPKAWTMALTAFTVYAPDRSLATILLVGVVFGLVAVPCTGTWTGLGQQLRRVLTSPRRLRAFNWTMALLLVASLIPVVYH